MKIIKLDQNSPEWLEWRRKGIGSSDIAALMDKCPFNTALKVYDEKTGLMDERSPSFAMIRGSAYEEEARKAFEKQISGKFDPVCSEHQEMEYARASLDGFNPETKEVLEIKVPGRKTLDLIKEGKAPQHYVIQVQWQLFITNSERAFLCGYWPETEECYIQCIERNDALIADLRETASKFWHDFKRGIPPAPQKGDFIEIRDPEFVKLAHQYKEAYKRKKDAEGALKGLKNSILEFGDDGNFQGGGLKCIRMHPRASYDLEAMAADGINIEKYLRIPKSIGYYQIRVNHT